MPNTLFDYLVARASILALVDEGGESARILSAVGRQHVIATAAGEPVPLSALGEALDRADTQRGEPVAADETVLESYLSARQLDHLADAIRA